MTLGARIALVVVLQTLVLAVMVGMKQYTLNTGTPIVLKTEPIDPRSLFSGDYVRLNYGISRLNLEQLAGDDDFEHHDRLYLVLERRDAYWEAVSVHHRRPEAAPGQVIIKGEVETRFGVVRDSADKRREKPKTIEVRYGIENYFVPEGEGHDLERPKPGEVVSIRVVVDKFGNTAIKAVLVNSKERYVERLL